MISQQLKVFLQVVESGSFNKAADQLFPILFTEQISSAVKPHSSLTF